MAETLSPRALCSEDDVKSYVGIATADTTLDDTIIRLCNSVANSFYRMSEREFVSMDVTVEITPADPGDPEAEPPVPPTEEVMEITIPDDVVRTFDVSERLTDRPLDGHRGYIVHVGDATEIASVTLKTWGGSETILDEADYDLLPYNREAWEPISFIRIRRPLVRASDQLIVEGQWGFPEIPEDVRQAAIEAVWARLVRDVRKFSAEFEAIEPTIYNPQQLRANSVWETLNRYTRPRLK
jgi:hypothetical protein